MRGAFGPILMLFLACGACAAGAQETRDLGLPPPSGRQNPVLPPPSGSQNPVLPPESGQRYLPGIGGQFGQGDPRPAIPRPVPPMARSRDLGGALSPETPRSPEREISRIDEIGPALRRCWNPPPLDGPHAGAMATVRFSLRRDGTLFGQPRLTWGTRTNDADLQERFGRSVIAAVQRCTPMRLSPGLGASIAGRPISIRFHGRVPSNERPI